MRGAGPLRCWSSANEAAGATKGASWRRSSGAPRRNMRRKQQALRVVTSEAARLGLNASEVEIDDAVASAIERQREAPFVSVEVERTGETTAPFNIFFPGILTMMVMFAVTLNAISIVEERLDGRLERLLTTGPGLNGIFGGKFLAGLVRGFMQAFILATLGWAVFRSFGPADYGAMLVVTAVLAAFTSAVGMAIASFARTREQANWSAVILTMVMATIGGIVLSNRPKAGSLTPSAGPRRSGTETTPFASSSRIRGAIGRCVA